MTRLAPLWQQNGSYPAATDRSLLGFLFPGSGVSGLQGAIVGNSMQVNVQPGYAAVALSGPGNYSAICRSDAVEPVTLATPPASGTSRIDVVICQVRDAVIDAGSNNDFIFTSVTGAPAASNPTVPGVPANAVAICQVSVPGGGSNLNAATLTDRRQPMMADQQLHSRVYRSSQWGVSTGGLAIPFDTVGNDAWGLYSIGQQRWNIQIAGWYLVHGFYSLIPNTAGQWCGISLYRNGAAHSNGTQESFGGAGYNWPTVEVTAAVFCNPTDYLQLFASSSVNLNCTGGPAATYGSCHYLGTG